MTKKGNMSKKNYYTEKICSHRPYGCAEGGKKVYEENKKYMRRDHDFTKILTTSCAYVLMTTEFE